MSNFTRNFSPGGTGIFLGLPNDAFEIGEKRLQARQAELLAKDVARRGKLPKASMKPGSGYVSAPSSQVRAPLPAPIPTHKTNYFAFNPVDLAKEGEKLGLKHIGRVGEQHAFHDPFTRSKIMANGLDELKSNLLGARQRYEPNL